MAHLIRSGKFDVVLTAFHYGLLRREAEIEVLPAALRFVISNDDVDTVLSPRRRENPEHLERLDESVEIADDQQPLDIITNLQRSRSHLCSFQCCGLRRRTMPGI